MGVNLDDDAVFGAGAQHLLDIDLEAGPALKLSSGYVANDRRMAIRNSLQRPLHMTELLTG
jgi:hypothetical protein